uniref:EF-hand domain-containing protein n=1 Tax=Eutreptiella gymnastica TaxID=73025 RepID=A0A7S4FEB3_9EUGL
MSVRSISLHALKDVIEEIYASKSKFDRKCSESQLPRETVEQHLYTYLNQKYGLKPLILEWAQAVIAGVRRYSSEDNDVAVFGKIMHHEIDEEFRFVQRQLKETVQELLRVYLRGKYQTKSEEEILGILHKKMNMSVQEAEWVDIVKYMYNAADAVSIIVKVREVIKSVSAERPKPQARSREEPTQDQTAIPYHHFVKVLLDFQLSGHEKFLQKFVQSFRRVDSDRNGVVSEHQFRCLLRLIDSGKSDAKINQLLDLIDPHNNQMITFSECVTFLSSELVALMGAA